MLKLIEPCLSLKKKNTAFYTLFLTRRIILWFLLSNQRLEGKKTSNLLNILYLKDTV